jgi:hypothetical protein
MRCVRCQRLTHGDEVDVLYDDGWWRMSFLGSRRGADGAEYGASSELYQVERWVAPEHVRPAWKRWGTKWRQLEQQQQRKPAKATSPKPTLPKPAPPKPAPPKPAPVLPQPAAALPKPAAALPKPAVSLTKPAVGSPANGMHAPNAHDVGGSSAGGAGRAPPPAPLPRPAVALPPMRPLTLKRCVALVEEMARRDDAIWFAQPVRDDLMT